VWHKQELLGLERGTLGRNLEEKLQGRKEGIEEFVGHRYR